MPVVLVTDGEQRASLAIVRSLGSAGYRCIVASTSGRSLAGTSRYAAVDTAVPGPAADPPGHVSAIEALVRAEQVDLLMPVTEAALLALLPFRERMPTHVPFPDIETFRAICDKERVLAEADRLGIRVPSQVAVRSGQEIVSPPWEFPVVLKPHRSMFMAPNGHRTEAPVQWVYERRDLESALGAYPSAAFPVLIQEVVRGPGIGIFVLVRDGDTLAAFSHRRIRERPPTGGVSVLRQSEPMDRELLAKSLALLETFDWSGVAMVEYKRDERTGEAVLMEINGRFWGSLQLAIDAGVDFPVILAEAALGGRPPRVESYTFARTRWFWGDVDHLIARWRDEHSTWAERLRSLAGWAAAFGPGCRSEVFRWTDPHPFGRETAQWIRGVAGR